MLLWLLRLSVSGPAAVVAIVTGIGFVVLPVAVVMTVATIPFPVNAFPIILTVFGVYPLVAAVVANLAQRQPVFAVFTTISVAVLWSSGIAISVGSFVFAVIVL